MLIVKNLTKIYNGEKSEIHALKNVTMKFGDSGLVFILGKSGSGKSTLLNILGGLDSPTSGEIILNGKSNSFFSPKDYDNFRNVYVGFVFQEYNLIEHYSVKENIELALELQKQKPDGKQVDKLLRETGLTDERGNTLAERKVNELSGGQKQRVAIARALIKNPKIILADEPTGALDSETGRQLYQLLKNLSRDRLVIVVSHDRENAFLYGDRVIEMRDGEIVGDECRAENKDLSEQKSELIKNKRLGLPLRRAFAIGVSGLRYNVFRLVCSILLSVISFIAFGFSVTALAMDSDTAELKSLATAGMYMIRVSSNNIEVRKTGENSTVTERKNFTQEQMRVLKEYVGGELTEVVTSSVYSGEIGGRVYGIKQYVGLSSSEYDDLKYNNPYYYLLMTDMTVFVELNPDTGAEEVGLQPDSRFLNKNLCRLPENSNEIAVTDLRADLFIEFGYREEDGTITEISSPDDLIGKKLGQYTICGVYSTEIDREYFADNKEEVQRESDGSYMKSYFYSAVDSIITYGFVYKDSLNETGEMSDCLIRFDGINKTKNMLQKLSYEENDQIYDCNLITVYSGFVLNEIVMDYVTGAAFIASVVLAIFSVLLFMNFLLVNIEKRKKELGILRGLGARRKDVVNICLFESFTIACLDFVISSAGTAILCFCLNKMFFLSLFNFDLIQLAALSALCFGVAALATVLPVVRISGKKPAEIIRSL